MTKKQLRAIRDQANANFKELGVKTQVKLFKGTFNKESYGKLDKTDAVAIIGKGENVVNKVKELNAEVGSEWQRSEFNSSGSVEKSTAAYRDGVDNIIGIRSEGVKEGSERYKASEEEVAAFVINHGAGHNAGLRHPSDRIDSDFEASGQNGYNSPLGSMMTDGNKLGNKKLSDFISSSSNTQPKLFTTPVGPVIANTSPVYKRLIQRFGDNSPNAKLPTQE